MKRIIVIVTLVLVGCTSDDPLPTSAPVIPPTVTQTLTNTPRPTTTPFPPGFETPDLNPATWTPSHTPTAIPTNTPVPTITPLPTDTPLPQPTPGLSTSADGTVRLILSVLEINDALIANLASDEAEFAPVFEIEPDGVWITFFIPNSFLEAVTEVRARIDLRVEENELGYDLLDSENENDGPQVTNEQIRAALDEAIESLNTQIAEALADEAREITDLVLLSGFLQLDARR